jgi:hypothetical protein
MRVTRKVLQAQLEHLNKMHGRDYALDEAHIYGGYCLTTENGSVCICGRRSAKEMYSYLEAAIAFSPITQGYQRFNVLEHFDAMGREK